MSDATMTIFEIAPEALRPLKKLSLDQAGVRERDDLQRLLRDQIEVIDPDLLIIAEEFGGWDASRRRIDLLGVDRQAKLVIVELKRGDTGAHMELQAIRYAAMISAMTFEQAVDVYTSYLSQRGQDIEAEEALLQFLGWEEPDEEVFGKEVRIVLAASDFGKELTTAVLWLNHHDLDIRCVRLSPYTDGARVFLDVQQVIPLPEAEEFQVRVREKERQERKARTDNRDMTRFDVAVNGQTWRNQAKRGAIFAVIRALVESGARPHEIFKAIGPKAFDRHCRVVDGHVSSAEFVSAMTRKREAEGRVFQPQRWYLADDELLHVDGRTYAVTRMWGDPRWAKAMQALAVRFPAAEIQFHPATEE